MDFVGAALGNHGDLSAGIAAVFGGGVGGEDLEFREAVGVGADGGKVAAAGRGLIGVDAINGVIPGAVACAVYVQATPSIGTIHDTRLTQDEIERIAPAVADDGKILDDSFAEHIADVARSGGLHLFIGTGYFDALGESAYFERDVDGGGLADADHVALGEKFFEAAGFDRDAVSADLNRFKEEGAVFAGAGGEGLTGAFICQAHGNSRDCSPRSIRQCAGQS